MARKLAALKCLAAWLKLDSAEADDALMSAGQFKATQVCEQSSGVVEGLRWRCHDYFIAVSAAKICNL